jgi:hypothetical protein
MQHHFSCYGLVPWSELRCLCVFAADLSWCHNICQVRHWLPSREPLQVSTGPQGEPNAATITLSKSR